MKRLSILLALLAASWSVTAQSVSPELLFPTIDPHSLAMGGMQLTTTGGSHAIYTNLSASLFAQQPIKFSTSYYGQSDFDYYALSGSWRVNRNNVLAAGWRQYLRGSGNNDSALDLGYAHRFGEHFSIGVVGRYARLERWDEDVEAIACDLSVMWSKPISGWSRYSNLRLGAKVTNLGAYLHDTDYVLPIQAALGASIDTFFSDSHQLTVGSELGYCFTPSQVRGFEASVGAEYNLMQLIQVRAGYHYGEVKEYCPSYASVGAGVRLLHIRVDFAYLFAEKDSWLDNTYSISFGLDF